MPTFTQDDAKAVAQAALDRINDEYIQAEGVSFGNPGVQTGKLLTIEGVSKQFSGKSTMERRKMRPVGRSTIGKHRISKQRKRTGNCSQRS